jgi:hypothetical protein
MSGLGLILRIQAVHQISVLEGTKPVFLEQRLY